MPAYFLFFLVLLPFVSGILVFLLRQQQLRFALVLATGAVVIATSLLLWSYGPFTYTLDGPWKKILLVLDYGLLAFFLYIGLRLKHVLITLFAAVQVAVLTYVDFFIYPGSAGAPTFAADHLSLIMILVISVVGCLIWFFSLPYMKKHEQEHLEHASSRQPRFFLFFLVFIGAMNGLVLVNDLLWLFFFWEVTTLCSFMLIAHDNTRTAVANAALALWMNLLGGAAMILGIAYIFTVIGAASLQDIVGSTGTAFLLPLALFCFAGFTKAAQVPFQSWLLGAMVAPTPVSALLHSAAMVKAGVYLVLRLAPAYEGTFLSAAVGIYGAFTFLAASALAISQSDGKRILAYSTVANLGLIIACAGINTALAAAAAIILIVFHALTKGLLFLCVGTIEQNIHSRDTEGMQGLMEKLPFVGAMTLIGILAMFLPPFGMLVGKWGALEAVPGLPLAVLLLVFGSVLTIIFWLRWAGLLVSKSPYPVSFQPQQKDPLIHFSLGVLGGAAVIFSFLITYVYQFMVAPAVSQYYPPGEMLIAAPGSLIGDMGEFMVWVVFLVLALAVFLGWWLARSPARGKVVLPYMCGEDIQEDSEGQGFQFMAAGEGWASSSYSSYYLHPLFPEGRLTVGSNLVAIGILSAMFGVVIVL